MNKLLNLGFYHVRAMSITQVTIKLSGGAVKLQLRCLLCTIMFIKLIPSQSFSESYYV